MPRTTRGSSGGGPRGRGGVGDVGPEEALFDAGGGRSSSSAAPNDHRSTTTTTTTTTGSPRGPRSWPTAVRPHPPGRPLARSSAAAAAARTSSASSTARDDRGAGVEARPPGTDAAGAGAPTSEDLLAMLGGGGEGEARVREGSGRVVRVRSRPPRRLAR